MPVDRYGTASYYFLMPPRTAVALAFSRADAAFSAALRGEFSRAKLRGLVDQGMGPVIFALEARRALSMSELAAEACVPRSTMTGVIDRMESRGLVRTSRNPGDARGVLVALTPRGRAVLPKLRDVERRLDEAIEQALADEDAARLVTLLGKFLRAFVTDS
jgi:DNA-binding MarR family transcriptional regulator